MLFPPSMGVVFQNGSPIREHGEDSIQSVVFYFITILHKIGMLLKLQNQYALTPTGISSVTTTLTRGLYTQGSRKETDRCETICKTPYRKYIKL